MFETGVLTTVWNIFLVLKVLFICRRLSFGVRIKWYVQFEYENLDLQTWFKEPGNIVKV
jgi:hypothetical protein